jgi:hypothetical protein
MASVFKQNVSVTKRTPIEVIRDTMEINPDGTLKFRCREGRGSGKGIEVPSDQIEEFFALVETVKDNYNDIVAREQANSQSDTPDTATISEDTQTVE